MVVCGELCVKHWQDADVSHTKPPGARGAGGDADWLFRALWLLLLCERASGSISSLSEMRRWAAYRDSTSTRSATAATRGRGNAADTLKGSDSARDVALRQREWGGRRRSVWPGGLLRVSLGSSTGREFSGKECFLWAKHYVNVKTLRLRLQQTYDPAKWASQQSSSSLGLINQTHGDVQAEATVVILTVNQHFQCSTVKTWSFSQMSQWFTHLRNNLVVSLLTEATERLINILIMYCNKKKISS